MRVLVTGASGFVGGYLIRALRDKGHEVTACSRSRVEQAGVAYVTSPAFGLETDWTTQLAGIEAVVHLAGIAAVDQQGHSEKLEAAYRQVNVDAIRALAKQAARAGIKHFVFMSSLHAVAAESDELITDKTPPHPVSAYGRSKLAAEEAVREELAGSSCAYTISRPPLVYGAGNQASFGLLLKLVKTGIPLPLASVRNRRSFIYVENLVDLISNSLGNPKAFGKIYLPSDGRDVSTPELIRKIAKANESVRCSVFSDSVGGRKTSHSVGRRGAPSSLRSGSRHSARLFPFPPSLLKAAGRLPGLGALKKLTSSLYVDSRPIRRDLGWTPPFSMEEGLRRTLEKSSATDGRR
jgi:nucleoside-diphosphate-sugar epimerase